MKRFFAAMIFRSKSVDFPLHPEIRTAGPGVGSGCL